MTGHGEVCLTVGNSSGFDIGRSVESFCIVLLEMDSELERDLVSGCGFGYEE